MNTSKQKAADEAGRQQDGALTTTLGTLTAVYTNSKISQRSLARELGIALGLANAYLKRCARKGFIKVHSTPARRYAYYLTPKGIAEKSRLTMAYLARSLSFFRQAREDFAAVFESAQTRGWSRIVLVGASDLAEIAAICALDSHLSIAAVVDGMTKVPRIAGLRIVQSFASVGGEYDGVVITDLNHPQQAFEDAVANLGAERVLAPSMFGLATSPNGIAHLTRGSND
jgi:DNA-binding MarR family transcriptional regulator